MLLLPKHCKSSPLEIAQPWEDDIAKTEYCGLTL